MENNLENKAKFFALYWGQRVLRFDTWTKNAERKEVGSFISDLYNDKCIIELKSLSSISDEDAFELSKFNEKIGSDHKFVFNSKESAIIYIKNNIHLSISNDRDNADLLRSRGYALPWMGLSVEELVNRGWIKLKGETK